MGYAVDHELQRRLRLDRLEVNVAGAKKDYVVEKILGKVVCNALIDSVFRWGQDWPAGMIVYLHAMNRLDPFGLARRENRSKVPGCKYPCFSDDPLVPKEDVSHDDRRDQDKVQR